MTETIRWDSDGTGMLPRALKGGWRHQKGRPQTSHAEGPRTMQLLLECLPCARPQGERATNTDNSQGLPGPLVGPKIRQTCARILWR